MRRSTESPEFEPILQHLVDEFQREDIPYKIRKTELLGGVGLPILETDYVVRGERELLITTIKDRLEREQVPIIVRVACIPDKLSMPVFYFENSDDIAKQIPKIERLQTRESTITHFIVQNATPSASIDKKISGRLYIAGKTSEVPVARTLEIYKGARSTGVLNRVRVDDPQFVRFEKEPGKFLKPTRDFSPSSTIQPSEIQDIMIRLSEDEHAYLDARRIVARATNRNPEDTELTFEFTYRDGQLTYTDFD